MGRNIAFFSDGTGNDRTAGCPTNVAKLCDLARNPLYRRYKVDWQDLPERRLEPELQNPALTQIAGYDPGVGTGVGGRLAALIGSATGQGISHNIQDAYKFIIRFYEPGDRIFLFGFSRGAYTVRSLAGLIGLCGVADRHQPGGVDLRYDADACAAVAREAYEAYRTGAAGKGASREARSAGKRDRASKGAEFRRKAYKLHQDDEAARAPYLIGVWDTVRSLGIPIGGRNLELELWPHRFHDHELSPHVRYAFHALSIDDDRVAFHPTIWNEPTLAERLEAEEGRPNTQIFSQVWFPGVHADVGGGYPGLRSGLSNVTLAWMARQTQRADAKLELIDDWEGTIDLEAEIEFHDTRDAVWKKVAYREKQTRSVVCGVQEPLSTRIEPSKDRYAHLHCSWTDLIARDTPTYRPAHLAEHPDYVTAQELLKGADRPLPRRWSKSIVDWPPEPTGSADVSTEPGDAPHRP